MKHQISKAINKGLKERYVFTLNKRQLEHLKTASQVVLAVVATTGIIALAIAAPNALKVLHSVSKLRKKYKNLGFDEKQNKLQDTFYYLRRSGLIRFRGEKSGLHLILTEKGKKFLEKLGFKTLQVKKPKIWDKKWWVVAADIPTKPHRQGADKLRQKLKDMGFCFLQRTLWFYPYDPRKEIAFIAQTYGVEKFITIMEVNRLDREDEQRLKIFFNL